MTMPFGFRSTVDVKNPAPLKGVNLCLRRTESLCLRGTESLCQRGTKSLCLRGTEFPQRALTMPFGFRNVSHISNISNINNISKISNISDISNLTNINNSLSLLHKYANYSILKAKY